MDNLKIKIILFAIMTLCQGKEYNISINTKENPKITPYHLRNDATNSAFFSNKIEIDIFQWRVLTNKKENVKVILNDPLWQPISYNSNVNLPEIIEISDLIIYKQTPTVHIRISPWRINNNQIESLISGEIIINVENSNLSSNYSHPFLLNQTNFTNRNSSNTRPYIIICNPDFKFAAQSLADMHKSEVDNQFQLDSEVITTDMISDEINGFKIRDYIIQRINESLNPNGFLVLFGDENDIPPIFSNNFPSDDFYSTPEIYSGDPQLTTGRIPVSNQNDAWNVVEKIRNYTLNPTPGIWRSKIALVADDMYKQCTLKESEFSHTQNSDDLFDSLHLYIPVQPYYGISYNIQNTSSGCEYPDLTSKLIGSINDGLALINYIGHGDSETWAGEKILTKSRDLPLINANNKNAIWIAGTCSFGKYNDENSFMEELLIKPGGAISIIAATDVVQEQQNSNYLNNLFGLNNSSMLGISDFISGNLNNTNKRLGELVMDAKNGDYHRFHLFGDPATRLPFPDISSSLFSPIESVPIVEVNNISINETASNTTLTIKASNKEINVDLYPYNLSYTMPGETFSKTTTNNINICFRIPIDADICNNCAIIQLFQQNTNEWKGKLQTNQNISIINSNIVFNDLDGPVIRIFQDNNRISNGSSLLASKELMISFKDTSGINLMKAIGHGIRYTFNNNDLKLIEGDEFIYQTCDSGIISIQIDPIINNGLNKFYIEGWDALNNKSNLELDLYIINNISKPEPIVDKIFPIPNPFSDNTNFTMFAKNIPVKISISIYSIMGSKVYSIEKFKATDNFISIPWNGKNQYGQEIANGTYFYQIIVEKDDNIVFEDIFKLSKIK